MQNSREISRDIRHAIADAMTNEGAEWSGWHDNVIDGPIERSVLPLVDALAASQQREARLVAAIKEALNMLDADGYLSDDEAATAELREALHAAALAEGAGGDSPTTSPAPT